MPSFPGTKTVAEDCRAGKEEEEDDDLDLLLGLDDKNDGSEGREDALSRGGDGGENEKDDEGFELLEALEEACQRAEAASSRLAEVKTTFAAKGPRLQRPRQQSQAFVPAVRRPGEGHGEHARPFSTSSKAEPQVFKGFRVKNPVVPGIILNERLSDVSYFSVLNLSRSTQVSGPWASLAVMTSKGKAKSSSAGQAYSVVKLGDLSGATVALFLFGSAFKEHWMESEGTVFAVFDAKLRVDEDGSRSLSVSSGEQLLKVGTAADFGFCKGTRKDGSRCTMAVNVRECEWCEYHAGEALKRMVKSRRPGMGISMATKSARAALTRRDRLSHKLGLHKGMFVGGGPVSVKPKAGVTPQPQSQVKVLQDVDPNKLSGRRRSRGEILVSHAITSAARKAEAEKAKSGAAPSLPSSLQRHQRSSSLPKPSQAIAGGGSGSSSRSQMQPSRAAQRPHPDKLRRHNDNEWMQLSDGDEEEGHDDAKARALAIVQAAGGLEALKKRQRAKSTATPKQNPHQAEVPPGDLQKDTSVPSKRPIARVTGSAQLPAAKAARAAGPVKHHTGASQGNNSFAASFGSVVGDVGDNIDSVYKEEAGMEEDEQIAKGLNFLEQKDKIAAKLEESKILEVKAWHCQTCKIITDRRHKECADHRGKPIKAVKRFFVCNDCKRRETTLNRRMPGHACTGCRARNFKQVGQYVPKDSAAGKLLPKAIVSAADMQARGHEHAFTLQQNLNLG
mmetsp:Transcript_27458/g.77665  ORF Transcript_27458/g.77665 Transcript_27458/m.77665 type:complete len:731 (-) Transcript_27458:328-2520(-)